MRNYKPDEELEREVRKITRKVLIDHLKIMLDLIDRASGKITMNLTTTENHDDRRDQSQPEGEKRL